MQDKVHDWNKARAKVLRQNNIVPSLTKVGDSLAPSPLSLSTHPTNRNPSSPFPASSDNRAKSRSIKNHDKSLQVLYQEETDERARHEETCRLCLRAEVEVALSIFSAKAAPQLGSVFVVSFFVAPLRAAERLPAPNKRPGDAARPRSGDSSAESEVR